MKISCILVYINLSTLAGTEDGRAAGLAADSSRRRLSGQVVPGIMSRQKSPVEPESSGGRDGMVSLPAP